MDRLDNEPLGREEASADRLDLLARVPLDERTALILHFWEGLSVQEIGEALQISESRVCKIHARLIDRLKDRFRVHLDG